MATPSELGESRNPWIRGAATLLPILTASCSVPFVAQAETPTITPTPETGPANFTEAIASQAAKKAIEPFDLEGKSYTATGEPVFSLLGSGELAKMTSFIGVTPIDSEQWTIGTVDVTDGKTEGSVAILVGYDTKTQKSDARLLLLHIEEQQGDTKIQTFSIASRTEASRLLDISKETEMVMTTPKSGASSIVFKNSDGSVEAIGVQTSPTAEPTLPSEINLVVFRAKNQLSATPETPVEPTAEPTAEPTKEASIPCETNLANWREYPSVPNLIAKIKSGEVAVSLHKQQAFENLMEKKGVKTPFNPEKIVKNITNQKEEYANRYYYIYGSEEAKKALSDPESRNMWIVCGFKTQEQGYDMLAFAVAYPSAETPGSHVYSFIVIPDISEIGDPGMYTKYLNAYLAELNTNGGQAMPIMHKKDPRILPNWDSQKNDNVFGWYPYLADAIGQVPGNDPSIQSLAETGKAPVAMEQEVHIGRLDTWKKIDWKK